MALFCIYAYIYCCKIEDFDNRLSVSSFKIGRRIFLMNEARNVEKNVAGIYIRVSTEDQARERI